MSGVESTAIHVRCKPVVSQNLGPGSIDSRVLLQSVDSRTGGTGSASEKLLLQRTPPDSRLQGSLMLCAPQRSNTVRYPKYPRDLAPDPSRSGAAAPTRIYIARQ